MLTFQFGRCCLGSRVPGPAACLCTHQQSALATCVPAGICLGSTICQISSSLTCTGSSSSLPLLVCGIPGATSCTNSGSDEVDLTWLVDLIQVLVCSIFLTTAFKISIVGSLEETSITLVPPQQNVYPHAHQAIQRLLSRAVRFLQLCAVTVTQVLKFIFHSGNLYKDTTYCKRH